MKRAISRSPELSHLFYQIRYIKLGSGSAGKDKVCIEKGIAYIGFDTSDERFYKAACEGDWEVFRDLYFMHETEGAA